HTEAVLRACPQAHVVGIDRDPHAIEHAGARLREFTARVSLVHAVYDEIPDVLARLGHRQVQGVLFDLGLSSMQIDVRERGFSYARDAPLDMRMDPSHGPTAADVLNTYSAAQLAHVLKAYGEERFANRIAGRIVRERDSRPFDTSARLVEVVASAIPAAARRTGHPAKRIFQALRIEVNDEISVLRRALPAAIDALALGGRVVVMSYHSLEDRLTKQVLAEGSRTTAPPDLPVVPAQYQPQLRLLTRGAEQADRDEIRVNPRAASVRLRAAERIRQAA
ncbi:MAG TPA: 16S rRNA (cytosine(1402)-N(4))-methyltransferase RsmH, partial [Nocardioidaceae bacterium]|nr:16S rRNA (cytosine(1402)-N(4))-methyltransferase RsmH [Nocardioidaceae bacterium]